VAASPGVHHILTHGGKSEVGSSDFFRNCELRAVPHMPVQFLRQACPNKFTPEARQFLGPMSDALVSNKVGQHFRTNCATYKLIGEHRKCERAVSKSASRDYPIAFRTFGNGTWRQST
jgi:hypothetical protein